MIADWIKSSFCPVEACVEVSASDVELPDAKVAAVAVRDSKNPAGGILFYTSEEWAAFIEGAKAGEFDHLITATTLAQADEPQEIHHVFGSDTAGSQEQ